MLFNVRRNVDSLNEQKSTQTYGLKRFFPVKQAIEKGNAFSIGSLFIKIFRRKGHFKTSSYRVFKQSGLNWEIPYAYRTFTENQGKYAEKYKAMRPQYCKPSELLKVDWEDYSHIK